MTQRWFFSYPLSCSTGLALEEVFKSFSKSSMKGENTPLQLNPKFKTLSKSRVFKYEAPTCSLPFTIMFLKCYWCITVVFYMFKFELILTTLHPFRLCRYSYVRLCTNTSSSIHDTLFVVSLSCDNHITFHELQIKELNSSFCPEKKNKIHQIKKCVVVTGHKMYENLYTEN